MSNIADLSAKLLKFWGNVVSGNVLTAQGEERPPIFSPGGGVMAFLGLTDTPGAYVADSFVVVNAGATALIFPTSFTFDEAGGRIVAAATFGPALLNVNRSVSLPSMVPSKAHPGTGLGGTGSGILSMIADFTELLRCTEDTPGLGNSVEIIAPVFRAFTLTGPAMVNEAVTHINPGHIPNRANLGTGLGGDGTDVSQIVSGVETTRADGSVVAGETRFMLFDVDNATLERVTVGIADSGGLGFKLLRIPN